MLQGLYRLMMYFLVSVVIVLFSAKFWSLACSRLAIRLYYGPRSGWSKVFMIVDPALGSLTKDLLVSAGYSMLDEPTAIITVTPEECLLNRCEPDLVVSGDSSFVYSNSLNYPLGKFDMNVLQYIGFMNGSVDIDRKLVGLKLWGDVVFFGHPAKSPNKSFGPLLVNHLASDQMLMRAIAVEEKLKELEKRKAKKEQDIEKMRDKTAKYTQLSRGALDLFGSSKKKPA